MRILGIDPGERRFGLSLSDALGLTAQGLQTFDGRTDGDFIAHVAGLVSEHEVTEIVVGHPVHLSGDESPSSKRARRLAANLQARCKVAVRLWDERFSSREAHRVLRGARAGKGAVDRVAASLILQSYLDYKKGRS